MVHVQLVLTLYVRRSIKHEDRCASNSRMFVLLGAMCCGMDFRAFLILILVDIITFNVEIDMMEN